MAEEWHPLSWIDIGEIVLFRLYEYGENFRKVYIIFKNGRDISLEINVETYELLCRYLLKKLIPIREV